VLPRFEPGRELHKHLLRGSQLDRSTLRQEFEQLHQAWPWSGLARFGPTTPTHPAVVASEPYVGWIGFHRAAPCSPLNDCHHGP
jgi:hypothetical protein